GIDHTTAYARRRTYADFAEGWERALKRFRAEKARVEEEEIAALRNAPSPSHGSAVGPSLSREGRGANWEDLVVANGQLKRVGRERWSKAKEAVFFEELAATANVQRAAKAAGVSS